MRRVAAQLGIQAPSLYKHFPHKAALEVAIIIDGFEEAASAFEIATTGADDQLMAFVQAYRAFATAHPHVYRLMTERPLPRDQLPEGLEARTAAPLLLATGDAARARAAWAFVHGLTMLELNDRLPHDGLTEPAWQIGVQQFQGPRSETRSRESYEGGSAVERGWRWDPTLYAGSASHYSSGRVPYPPQLVTALVDALGLDGTGRLLDVGCGPGSLTLLLAPYVAEAIGIDADPDMLAEADRLARLLQVPNTHWRHLRGEDLPADLAPVDLVIFAQSFHWMDRRPVAAAVRDMLIPGGALVHVHATTHQGTEEGTDESSEQPPGAADLAPRPPWAAITDLVRRYLGAQPRAGQSVLPAGIRGGDEAVIYRDAGFDGPQHIRVPGRRTERTADEIFAAVHSLSSAAPHLFGDRLDAFDTDLRDLLATTSRDGRFSEQMPAVDVDIWR